MMTDDLTSPDALDEEKRRWLQEMSQVMADAERRLHQERAQLDRTMQNELRAKREKLKQRKHEEKDRMAREWEQKYQYEEKKAEAVLDELNARKKQLASQLKDRMSNRISSQLQSLRLQHDKVKTQIKIDNDRILTAQRDEIRSRLESKFIKNENEYRLKNLQMIKRLQTVEVEKLKINKQQELN